jgi:hypothetical protein
VGVATATEPARDAPLAGAPAEAQTLGYLLDYAHPRAAFDRLVARGLAEKVAPGVYRAVVVRERRI